MQKLLFLLLTSLIFLDLQARTPEFTLQVDGGYRRDELKWSIQGPGGFPNVLSELKWDNVQSYQVSGTATYVNCYNYYFRGRGDYAWIFKGDNKDTDYAGNNKTNITSLSTADTKGYLYDASAGIGYYFGFLHDRVVIAPIGGYSFHEQHYKMDNLFVEIDEDGPVGPIPGLDSSYRARWNGPWVGADFILHMTCRLTMLFTGEYHWAHYRGNGDWNLRDDFVDDFKHHAWGHGQVYYLTFNYDFCHNLSIGLTGNYQNWYTGTGHDHTYFIDGVTSTRLNKARWHSWSIMGSLNYRY